MTLLQVTPKSRTEVAEYAAMNREINELVGQINGRHADPSWTPIRYVNRSYSRAALAGIYRSAQVALVTPLRDGMNLVAKEYVAAQDSADPGVLVLSQFAGAAQELELRPDRQSPRDRGDGRGDQGGARHAAGRAHRAPHPHDELSGGQRHRPLGGAFSYRARRLQETSGTAERVSATICAKRVNANHPDRRTPPKRSTDRGQRRMINRRLVETDRFAGAAAANRLAYQICTDKAPHRPWPRHHPSSSTGDHGDLNCCAVAQDEHRNVRSRPPEFDVRP